MNAYTYDVDVFVEFCCVMQKAPAAERESFITRAKSIPYAEFLQSGYWAMIRGAALREGKSRCRFCGSRFFLEVHHKTYKHRGEEWEHLGDLEILCGDCHSDKHHLATHDQIEKLWKRRLSAWSRA